MRVLLFIPLALLLFASCKKADTPLSRQEELRSGNWRLASGTYKYKQSNGKDTTLNYFDVLADCKEDDYLVFETNYEGLQNTGSNKCSGADPETIPFTWELVNNNAGINFYNANYMFNNLSTVNASFINYSASRFTIWYFVYKTIGSQKDTFTYTNTFVK